MAEEKEAEKAPETKWHSATDKLPPMYENVIVWGIIESINVLQQAYQARRWTGYTMGFDVEKDKLWVWLTPCDAVVKNVTKWVPMPKDESDCEGGFYGSGRGFVELKVEISKRIGLVEENGKEEEKSRGKIETVQR